MIRFCSKSIQTIVPKLRYFMASRKEVLPWISAILASALLVWDCSLLRPWILDDAFIFFRYAENLAHGHGVVFNLGDKVEGYTSFLWVAILGGCSRLGFEVPLSATFLGYFSSIACFFLLASAHHFGVSAGVRARIWAPLLLVATRTFSPWARSGMEVPLFSFFLVLFLLNAIRVSRLNVSSFRSLFVQGCVGVLLALSRPEGLYIVVIVLMDSIIHLRKEAKFKIGSLLAPFLLFYFPYLVWKYHYFGYFAPNTYYAKVSMGSVEWVRGWLYVREFLRVYFILVVPILLMPLLASSLFRKDKTYLFWIVLVLQLIYTCSVGGDYLPAFRFLAPFMPVLVLMTVLFFEPLTVLSRLSFLTMVVFLTLHVWLGGKLVHEHVKTNIPVAQGGHWVGLWLKENVSSDAVIATNTAGTIPYYSRLQAIDMLGLTDKHIAHSYIPGMGSGVSGHEKGNGPYVLLRNPDFIQFGSSFGEKRPMFLSDSEIYRSPSFKKNYELKKFRLPQGYKLLLYVRRGSGKLKEGKIDERKQGISNGF